MQGSESDILLTLASGYAGAPEDRAPVAKVRFNDLAEFIAEVSRALNYGQRPMHRMVRVTRVWHPAAGPERLVSVKATCLIDGQLYELVEPAGYIFWWRDPDQRAKSERDQAVLARGDAMIQMLTSGALALGLRVGDGIIEPIS